MAIYIVKLDDYYMLWSTVSDGPVSPALKFDEFKKYYINEGLKKIKKNFNEEIKLAKKNGCSSTVFCLDFLLKTNRSGPGGICLPKNGIIKRFVKFFVTDKT